MKSRTAGFNHHNTEIFLSVEVGAFERALRKNDDSV